MKLEELINILPKRTHLTIEDDCYNDIFKGNMTIDNGTISKRLQKLYKKDVKYMYAYGNDKVNITIKI